MKIDKIVSTVIIIMVSAFGGAAAASCCDNCEQHSQDKIKAVVSESLCKGDKVISIEELHSAAKYRTCFRVTCFSSADQKDYDKFECVDK
jgi:hypothetical protein